MLSLFVCFVKDNIILDIAVASGISMALAVIYGCITVVLLGTVLHPPGIGCSADTNGSTHNNYYCFVSMTRRKCLFNVSKLYFLRICASFEIISEGN